MAVATIVLNISGVTAAVARLIPPALESAGRLTAERLRADLATPYPPASAANHPPHRRTGQLQASIGYEVVPGANETVLRVGAEGSKAPYALPLEMGTPRVAPRPFIAPRVDLLRQAAKDAVASIAGVGPVR